MKLIYPAIFSPLEAMSGYCVEFPDLPGCVTQGENLEDAVAMAQDAASGWILSSIEDAETLPTPSQVQEVSGLEDGAFVSLVVLNMDEYAKQQGFKAVKKTLTLPAWLDTAAERAGLNFSQVLQEGLKQKLGVNN